MDGDPSTLGTDVSLLRLRFFTAVIDEGGYSAAARSLGVSQPTVSFHVRALERVFGDDLLTFRGRRVYPTAAGEALYGLAERLLRDVEETRANITSLQAGNAGRLRLGASIAFEQFFFFDAVVQPFAREHRDVELSIRFGTSREVAEGVRRRELSLGYVMAVHLPADVDYTPLHGSHVVFFVSENHPLASEPAPTTAALSTAGLITAPLNSYEWDYYRHVLQEVGLRQYRVALEVSGIQARILAAQAGMGVLAIFWPPYAPSPSLAGLRPLSLAPTHPAGPEFGLLTRPGEPVAPAVDAFVDWLRGLAGCG